MNSQLQLLKGLMLLFKIIYKSRNIKIIINLLNKIIFNKIYLKLKGDDVVM